MSKMDDVSDQLAAKFDYTANTEHDWQTASKEVAKQLNDYAGNSSLPAKQNLIESFNRASLSTSKSCEIDAPFEKSYAEASVENDGSIVIVAKDANDAKEAHTLWLYKNRFSLDKSSRNLGCKD